MKLLEAVVLRIQQAGLGTPGQTLFHTHMPASAAEAVMVMSRVPIMIDPYTGLKKGTFQVIVRSSKIEIAQDKAEKIIEALVTEGARVKEVNFLFIKAEYTPVVFPRTPGGQFEASVNYNFAANWE